MAEKPRSSVPGMGYPRGRDHFLKTSFGFLEGRRRDDGAEGLWRIGDRLYDLEDFAKSHPGGSEWISITKGTDITEAFEAHHVSERPERLLPKFFARKADPGNPRSLPYTFEPTGFYRRFKARARAALEGVDYHSPSPRSKLVADGLALATLVSVAAAASCRTSWGLTLLSGLMLTWTTIVAHNFFHMRDNFRMYYFDLSLMSSKNWRISHALSHHLYPNTLWDMEIYAFEPYFGFLPRAGKSLAYWLWSCLLGPFFWSCAYFFQGVQRYYSVAKEWRKPEWRDAVPLVLPLTMSLFAPSALDALRLWLCVLAISSTLFHFVGLTAAHHHPEIFHDGDVCRQELDWGLMELDAVRDRELIDDSLFLVLVSFGSHGLHHLLPTVDHAYLDLCLPAFLETCREFGVDSCKLSQWELVKGQYRQLVRTEPRVNYRGGPDGGPLRGSAG